MFLKIAGPLSENIIQLKKSRTKIGLDSGNDIVLMGSSIGEYHCEILLKDNEFYIKQIDTEEVTYHNDKALGPSVTYKFLLQDNLKLGEFTLTLSKIGDQSSQTETENEYAGLSDDELLAQIDNIYAKSNKVKKNNYKIGSHLDFEEKETEEPFSSIPDSTLLNNPSHPSVKSARKNEKDVNPQRHRRTVKKQDSYSLQFIMYLSLGVILTGYIYYTKYYKPAFLSSANLEKKLQRSEINLSGLYKKQMSAHLQDFIKFFSSEKCNGDVVKESCSKIWTSLRDPSEGVLINGDTLIIGQEVSTLQKQSLGLLENMSLSNEELKLLINKDYSRYFSFEEFQGNGHKPPTQLLKNQAATYKRVNLLYYTLIQIGFDVFKAMPVRNILYFDYTQTGNQIFIEDFIFINDFPSRLEQLSADNFSIKEIIQYLKYELSNGVETFYKTRMSTHISDFDSDLASRIRLEGLKKTLLSLDDSLACNEQFLNGLCEQYSKFLSTNNSPIFLKDKKLFLGTDYSVLKSQLDNSSKKYQYNNIEFSNLVRMIKQFNKNIDTKKLLSNNYIFNPTQKEILPTMIFYTLVELEKLHDQDFLSQIEKLVFYVFQGANDDKKILASIDVKLSVLNKLNKKIYLPKIEMYLRSHVPVFNFEIERLGNVIMFEEIE